MFAIRQASVFTPDGIIAGGTVRVDGSRIVALGPGVEGDPSTADVDGRGLLLIPGLIDLQCNGLCGYELLDGTEHAVRGLLAVLPRFGCTAVLPTLITAPREVLLAGLSAIAAVARAPGQGATVLGTHLEGPWLSPSYHGAHQRSYVRPFSASELVELVDAARGTLRLVTLAPEAAGNEHAVRAVADTGALVSLGHSGATYEQALEAVQQGARMATHCFNAMGPLHHRAPGLAGAALDRQELIRGLIPDGHHVHPAVMRLIARARGIHGLAVVTDSVASAGLPPGDYTWHGRTVHWDGEVVRLPDGGLAGSGLTPIEALRRYMVLTGLPLAEALPAMTSTPARLLGEQGIRGVIAVGAQADLVLLTQDLQVQITVVGGTVAYGA